MRTNGGDGFSGRSAIVTGGASGIGLAFGRALAGSGAHVTLADLDAGVTERAATQIGAGIGSAGGSVTSAVVDVRELEAVTDLVDTVIDRHGALDLMFNNAGTSMGGETHRMSAEHWDRIIDVNLRGVVNGVLAAYPRMIDQGSGHLVNTASAAGLAPTVMTVAYAATKHAVVGLSTSLRPEATRHGVRVSVVCPGAVETPLLDQSVPADLPPFGPDGMTGRAFLALAGITPMPAARFADQVLGQVARNRGVIVAPWNVKAIWYLNRISPSLVDRVSRILVGRALDHPGQMARSS